MLSQLLRRPSAPDPDGRIHHVTPQNAGWAYVVFDVYTLATGATLRRDTGEEEICLVLLSGKAEIAAGGQDFGMLGGRESVFDGSPHSVYVPAQSSWALIAETPVELAVCGAPGTGKLQA